MQLRDTARCLTAWRVNVEERRRTAVLLRRAAARLLLRTTAAAWARWQEWLGVQQLEQRRQQLGESIVRRMAAGAVARSLQRWAGYASERRRTAVLLRRAAGRLLLRSVAEAWTRWREGLGTLQRERQQQQLCQSLVRHAVSHTVSRIVMRCHQEWCGAEVEIVPSYNSDIDNHGHSATLPARVVEEAKTVHTDQAGCVVADTQRGAVEAVGGSAGDCLRRLFDAIDVDSVGSLDAENGRAFFHALGLPAEEQDYSWQDVLRCHGADGGTVSKSALVQYVLRLLELGEHGRLDPELEGLVMQKVRQVCTATDAEHKESDERVGQGPTPPSPLVPFPSQLALEQMDPITQSDVLECEVPTGKNRNSSQSTLQLGLAADFETYEEVLVKDAVDALTRWHVPITEISIGAQQVEAARRALVVCKSQSLHTLLSVVANMDTEFSAKLYMIEQKHKREYLRSIIKRVMSRKMKHVTVIWMHYANERRRARTVVQRAVRRLQLRDVVRCFTAWRANAAEQRRTAVLLRRAAAQILLRTAAVAWARWREWVGAKQLELNLQRLGESDVADVAAAHDLVATRMVQVHEQLQHTEAEARAELARVAAHAEACRVEQEVCLCVEQLLVSRVVEAAAAEQAAEEERRLHDATREQLQQAADVAAAHDLVATRMVQVHEHSLQHMGAVLRQTEAEARAELARVLHHTCQLRPPSVDARNARRSAIHS